MRSNVVTSLVVLLLTASLIDAQFLAIGGPAFGPGPFFPPFYGPPGFFGGFGGGFGGFGGGFGGGRAFQALGSAALLGSGNPGLQALGGIGLVGSFI